MYGDLLFCYQETQYESLFVGKSKKAPVSKSEEDGSGTGTGPTQTQQNIIYKPVSQKPDVTFKDDVTRIEKPKPANRRPDTIKKADDKVGVGGTHV